MAEVNCSGKAECAVYDGLMERYIHAPVEFGAELDVNLDSLDNARLEKMSFEAYNESTCLR